MTISVTAPGKLYLAGEYAVVTAGEPALIMAVNRYLTATISKSEVGRLYSSQQPDLHLTWYQKDDTLTFDQAHDYDLVVSAMTVAGLYLRGLGQPMPVYDLRLHSDLDDEAQNIKYGLGSSAAVTVAVIKAVLALVAQPYTADLLYRLASLAHIRLGKAGSLGDIASASYGGLIAYRSPDRALLFEKWQSALVSSGDEVQVIRDLLVVLWQGLAIERLNLPRDLQVLVGWTGTSALTDKLVKSASQAMTNKAAIQANFIKNSRECVTQMIAAIKQGKREKVLAGLRQNRELLQDYARQMQLVIETRRLSALCDIAESYGAAAKTSGAGGGDCGIALVDDCEFIEDIYAAWEKAGILPLKLGFAPAFFSKERKENHEPTSK